MIEQPRAFPPPADVRLLLRKISSADCHFKAASFFSEISDILNSSLRLSVNSFTSVVVINLNHLRDTGVAV